MDKHDLNYSIASSEKQNQEIYLDIEWGLKWDIAIQTLKGDDNVFIHLWYFKLDFSNCSIFYKLLQASCEFCYLMRTVQSVGWKMRMLFFWGEKNKGILVNLSFSYSISLGAPLPKESKYAEVPCLITELATVCSLFQSFIRIFFSLSNHASCSSLRPFLLDLFIKDMFLLYIF